MEAKRPLRSTCVVANPWIIDFDEHVGSKEQLNERQRAVLRWDGDGCPIETPSGRLVLTLENDWQFNGRRRSWADRHRWRLEDKLGEVLAEIRWRLEALQARQRAKERALAQRREDWQTAMERARIAHGEAQRVAALDGQLAAWEKAKQIRAYCTELEAARGLDVDDELRGWINWARSHADAIDPTGRADLPPAVVEPRTHDLAPLLPKGMSPYSPPQA